MDVRIQRRCTGASRQSLARGRVHTMVPGGHPASVGRRYGRVRALGALVGFVALLPLGAGAFQFDDVVNKAQALASRSYAAPDPVPAFMRELSYDAFRSIRFDPKQSLWRGSGSRFQVMLKAAGGVFPHPVKLNVVDRTGVRPIPFRKDTFSFGISELEKRVPADLGYAGFTLTYPINRPDVQDQFLAFAGASYFRGVGKGNAFGLSARGAAIDTALMTGEEFPAFVEYWLVWPRAGSEVMQLFGLLDSPRMTGAYRFTVRPERSTRVEVDAVLFSRSEIELLGVAPLTSMYFYGENTQRPSGNWRPEVHDSDGLLIRNGTGEWLWRPLLNPRELQVHAFEVENAGGFGLQQRDAAFASYNDAEADYERRPSAWVDLGGRLGKGRVVLVQIPTRDETNDNIVAFWAPAEPVKGGTRLDLTYSVSVGGPLDIGPPGATVNTFVGRGDVMGGGNVEGAYRFIVDFAGGGLARLGPDAPVVASVTPLEGGELLEQYVEYVEQANLWRLSILARPADAEQPLALRAFLKAGEETVSETWTYHLPAQNAIRAEAK